MKSKLLVFILVVSSVCTFANAQQNGLERSTVDRRSMQVDKVTFINNRVGFTEGEAKRFWSLYENYRRQLHQSREVMREMREAEKETQKDYQDALDIMQAERVRQDMYEREFYNSLTDFLTPQKIYLYYDAEDQYKKHLVRKIEDGPKKK